VIRLVLFDFDGTIANTLPIWVLAYQEVLKRYGKTATKDEVVQKCLGRGRKALLFLDLKDQQSYWEQVNEYAAEHFSKAKLFDHVPQTLASLTAVKKAVTTSSRRSLVEPYLKEKQIYKEFNLILGEEDVDKLKPDPEVINQAMGKLHVPPDQTVIIGDSDKDILAGQAAGIRTILFYPAENHAYYQAKRLRATQPEFEVESYRELPDLISSL